VFVANSIYKNSRANPRHRIFGFATAAPRMFVAESGVHSAFATGYERCDFFQKLEFDSVRPLMPRPGDEVLKFGF
jgi:hypothetical protein